MELIKKLALLVVAIGLLMVSFFLSLFIFAAVAAVGLAVAARIWWLKRQQQGKIIEGEYRHIDD